MLIFCILYLYFYLYLPYLYCYASLVINALGFFKFYLSYILYNIYGISVRTKKFLYFRCSKKENLHI
ncbi:hypothetical protein V1511DRAFT_160003 [Dipodascopsis uninucleata]